MMGRLKVRVIPGAGRFEIAGWQGDTLRIRVAEPARAGRANAGLVRGLARTLGLPESAVAIRRGHAARIKLVEVTGLEDAELLRRLGGLEHG
jgi:uncharacterized protein YggU (UPF0235/DUF167 family)